MPQHTVSYCLKYFTSSSSSSIIHHPPSTTIIHHHPPSSITIRRSSIIGHRSSVVRHHSSSSITIHPPSSILHPPPSIYQMGVDVQVPRQIINAKSLPAPRHAQDAKAAPSLQVLPLVRDDPRRECRSRFNKYIVGGRPANCRRQQRILEAQAPRMRLEETCC